LIGIAMLPPYNSPAYAYNAAKAARAHALLLARDEAWRNGVTVNIVGPGPVPEIESLAWAIEQCDHGPAGAWDDVSSGHCRGSGFPVLGGRAVHFRL